MVKEVPFGWEKESWMVLVDDLFAIGVVSTRWRKRRRISRQLGNVLERITYNVANDAEFTW
jgi:hypothetical protein